MKRNAIETEQTMKENTGWKNNKRGHLLPRIHGMILAACVAVLAVFPRGQAAAAQSEQGPELYCAKLKNFVVPLKVLETTRSNPKKMKHAELFVEVSINGVTCWRSPGIEFQEGTRQEHFVFPDDTMFPLWWQLGNDVFVQVKMAPNKALAKAGKGGIGASIGGGVGGVVGGVTGGVIAGTAAAAGSSVLASSFAGAAAGTAAGPAGWIAGAAIGAGIGIAGGALLGGGTGALLPVKGERVVVSFVLPSDRFALNGTLETKVDPSSDDLLLSGKATMEWQGLLLKNTVPGGSLYPKKTYVVRARATCLSDQAEGFKTGAEYYLRLKAPGLDAPAELGLGKLSANTVLPLGYALVLKNSDGGSSIEIRRKKVGRDVLVFRAASEKADGRDWVFCGKHEDSNGSFVEFETLSLEE